MLHGECWKTRRGCGRVRAARYGKDDSIEWTTLEIPLIP